MQPKPNVVVQKLTFRRKNSDEVVVVHRQAALAGHPCHDNRDADLMLLLTMKADFHEFQATGQSKYNPLLEE